MISTSKVVRPIGSAGATARRTMATGKDIKFGSEGRQGMLAGINKLADAVQSTLGPKGRPSILEQAFGAPNITKDGVTVAKNIEFKDPLENMGAQLMRQAATRTNDVAGDGTTTATTLCRAIATEGETAVAAKLNPMALKNGMSMAVDVVLAELSEMSTPVTSTEEIASVATISANGDRVVGNLIAEAMERVSREGVISVSEGRTLEDELEVVEGMRFDRGFISPYFITDPKTQSAEFENPLILLVEKKVSTFAPLVPLLEVAIRDSKPLLIIAEDVESDALTSLVMNKLRGGVKVAAVKAPGFGDNRKSNLQDLAELTGATVISEETGTKIENTTIDMLGGCGKVTISKDATLILNGAGSKEAIAARCDTIKEQIAGTKSEYEKEKLQERLAKLAGGVAVIKVGGATEVEVGEKKDRITDALNATRAAVEEGIVPGGGAALLHASKKLAALKESQKDQSTRVGIEIIERAIVKPAAAIAKNAGVSGDVVVGKLMEEENPRVGFNALSMEYEDMVTAGIIDPTKVVRTALTDASSIAGLLTITEAVVFEEPDDSPAPAMPPMGGGMGGMGGGMGF